MNAATTCMTGVTAPAASAAAGTAPTVAMSGQILANWLVSVVLVVWAVVTLLSAEVTPAVRVVTEGEGVLMELWMLERAAAAWLTAEPPAMRVMTPTAATRAS